MMKMYFDSEPIIRKLQEECMSKNLQYLHRVKYNNEGNIMISCPFHANGSERNPSCGVKRDENIGHCFTCGWVGRVEDIVSKVLNLTFDEAQRWLLKNFTNYSYETRIKPLEKCSELLPLTRNTSDKLFRTEPFTSDDLSKYNMYHEYLWARGISRELASTYQIGFDDAKNEITFPIYSLSGEPICIARRSVIYKRFDYPKGVEKPLYLGHLIQPYEDELWICEGCFDALTAIKFGHKAVALMGLSSENQIKDLRSLKCKSYVLALDNDSAGKQASEKLYHRLKDIGVIYRVELPEGKKDLNECGPWFDKIKLFFY